MLSSSPISSEKPSSPRPDAPNSRQPDTTSSTRRPLALVQLIETEFAHFDCEDAVVFPFQDEAVKDDTFQKELNEMLLDAALETHAWALARSFHETELATHKFQQQIKVVQQQEAEQEQTRQRLKEFVNRMRSALAALTGMS